MKHVSQKYRFNPIELVCWNNTLLYPLWGIHQIDLSEVWRFKMRCSHGLILIVFRFLFVVVDAQGKFVYKAAADNIVLFECRRYILKLHQRLKDEADYFVLPKFWLNFCLHQQLHHWVRQTKPAKIQILSKFWQNKMFSLIFQTLMRL